MSLKPLARLFKNHQFATALRANALYKPYYSVIYVATARSSGLLEMLAAGPRHLDELVTISGDDAKRRDALEAWLRLGVRLRLLHHGRDGYRLHGLAKKLARPENDATLALLQEAASLHYKLIHDTPDKLRAGELWELVDQDGELTTRSSRALEPFVAEAVDAVVDRRDETRLLEIGCGSAIYIKHAADRNPALRALGVELQSSAAEVARDNVRAWGLAERVDIEVGDIRGMTPTGDYDCVTLHNNIYYFPLDERVAMLRHVVGFLKPGGRLLLTTCCRGGNAGMEVLNLWGAATAGAGRLPSRDEMRQQLSDAGLAGVRARRLIPGDALYAFVGGVD